MRKLVVLASIIGAMRGQVVTRNAACYALRPDPQQFTPTATTSYRSFIALGAVRCDQDVGLHALLDTFRI